MKKISRFLEIIIITAIAIVFIAACFTDPYGEVENTESPYIKNTLIVSNQQVWKENRIATKISEVYSKYKSSHVVVGSIRTSQVPYSGFAGWGDIANGILSFEDSGLEGLALLDWESSNPAVPCLKMYFPEWKNVNVSDTDVKGSNIMLLVYDEDEFKNLVYYGALLRERITGTGTTITCDRLYYFYVDRDCEITGDSTSNYIPGLYYYTTENNLSLSLKKGWNILIKKETYGTTFNGHARIDWEIKKPIKSPEQFKWVIRQVY